METTSPTQLERLREQREQLILELEVSQLRRQTRVLDDASRVVDLREAYGDTVDPRGYLTDSPGFGFDINDYRISTASDRKHGANWPFWQTEQELSVIRGIARHIACTDEVAISALDNLANYVLGSAGFEYKVTPRDEYQAPDNRLIAAVQAVINTFLEDNDWEGDLERELFMRSRRDGEFFLSLVDAGGGIVQAETLEPDEVTEPGNPRQLEDYMGLGPGLDWKFGVAKTANRPGERLGYFVSHFGDGNDWEYLPICPTSGASIGRTACMVHAKINVDRVVCRGLSDYYAVYQDLERVSKLLSNTLQGGAVQAAIAYIKEHPVGTRANDIALAATGKTESTYTLPAGPGGYAREVSTRRIVPGTVIDTAGTKYHSGPLGTPHGTSYIEIAQAGLRYVGQRWTMPEYLISGDASNGNFSSTLVAEAPFTKSIEAKQSFYIRTFANVFWRVLEIAVRAGRFRSVGIDFNEFRMLKQLVDIDVSAPEVAVRNRLEDHQIRREEFEAGILSDETWAAEVGRDLDAERMKGAQRQQLTTSAGASTETTGDGKRPQRSSSAVRAPTTAVGTATTAAASETPENIESQTGLNGAQITAAKDLMLSLSAGLMAPEAVLELLVSLGLERELATKMVNATKTVAITPAAAGVSGAGNAGVQERLQRAASLLWERYP